MSDSPDRLFSDTAPGRLFVKAAVPGALGMLASSLYYLLEGIFIGRILGSEALAGMMLGLPFVLINFALSDLVGVGSSVPIAIELGRGNRKEACNIFSASVILIVILNAVVGIILCILSPWMFSIMGADAGLVPLAVDYVRVYALFSPLTGLVFAVDNYLRISGRIHYSLSMNILMAVICTISEIIALVVFDGGIGAAAAGTSAGMIITLLFSMMPFIRGKLVLRFTRPSFHRNILYTIFSCGTPTFLSNIAGRITSIVMNVILLAEGGAAAVSVYGILMSVDGVVMPLLYGTCDSLQPAVGYNYGAGRNDRVISIEKYCYAVGAAISIISAILFFAFPSFFVSLFIEGDGDGISMMGAAAMRLFSFTYLTRWFSFATQSFMSAIGKARYASVISVSIALVFPMLMIPLLIPLGLDGLWLNLPAASLLALILSLVVLRKIRLS